jgi:hypothetical protein
MQASLLGDFAQRETCGLGIGKCLTPRLAHVLRVPLKPALGYANGPSSLLLGIAATTERLVGLLPTTDSRESTPSGDGMRRRVDGGRLRAMVDPDAIRAGADVVQAGTAVYGALVERAARQRANPDHS